MNLALSRTPGHRHLYAVEGVGTLRLEGAFAGRATAEAAGQRWRIARHGFWGRLQATDDGGAVVGTFARRLLGGGTVRWGDREFAMRRASVWRERYTLADGDHEIAVLDARGWGRRPVTITVDDRTALDPGLVLYAAYIAHRLAGDADAGAVAAVTAVTASSG